MRLTQGQLKIFNHLRFFFVLGSYSLSTLVSLVHLNFSLPPNSKPSAPLTWPTSKTAWRLVSLLSAHCSKLKTSVVIYFSDAPASSGYSSGIPFTQFPWHFRCLEFTWGHRCILFLKSICMARKRSICNIGWLGWKGGLVRSVQTIIIQPYQPIVYTQTRICLREGKVSSGTFRFKRITQSRPEDQI